MTEVIGLPLKAKRDVHTGQNDSTSRDAWSLNSRRMQVNGKAFSLERKKTGFNPLNWQCGLSFCCCLIVS